jgi:hypothetical protein
MTKRKVFISYSHRDAEWVRQFAEALREQDVDAWFDDSQIKAGEAWDETIEMALRGSDAIVAVLTSASANSPYMFAEYGAALGMGKPYIPIISSDLEKSAIPSAFRARRSITSSEPDEAAREVAKAVKAQAA